LHRKPPPQTPLGVRWWEHVTLLSALKNDFYSARVFAKRNGIKNPVPLFCLFGIFAKNIYKKI
jgi:hypothetical protein